MPTLVLFRHAKAEAHREDDHSRQLASRGRADAVAAREWLTQQGIAPDRVVVSTAMRARQTWECGAVGQVPPVYDGRVYEATAADLLEVLRETPAGTGTVVLVGHNPGVEHLAWELDDSDTARDRTNGGLATCGLAVFEVTGWAGLSAGVLREVAVPRG